jgi:hypothetical protein
MQKSTNLILLYALFFPYLYPTYTSPYKGEDSEIKILSVRAFLPG